MSAPVDLEAIRARHQAAAPTAGWTNKASSVFEAHAWGDIRDLLAEVGALREALRRIEAGEWTESGDLLGAAWSELRAVHIAREALRGRTHEGTETPCRVPTETEGRTDP